MISYKANRIGCEEVDGVLIAGVGNESAGYVMFQRGTTPETGCDEPPYFEFDDQVNGGNDILRSVVLRKKQLLIRTTLPSEGNYFEISLDAAFEDIALLASQLRAIFVGYEDKLHLDII